MKHVKAAQKKAAEAAKAAKEKANELANSEKTKDLLNKNKIEFIAHGIVSWSPTPEFSWLHHPSKYSY